MSRYRQGKYGGRRAPDGPRIQPITRTTPDDLFYRQQDLARLGRDGAAQQARRLLAAWLRGQVWAGCFGCGRALDWKGKWVDMPQCPYCQFVPKLEELQARDAEFTELSRTPPARPCEKCSKPMSFVVNVGTGKEVPIDVAAVVYVTFLPAVPGGALGEVPVFEAMTTKALAASGAKLVFPDGREIPAADFGFYVTHYATCPSAAHFSAKGGMRR